MVSDVRSSSMAHWPLDSLPGKIKAIGNPERSQYPLTLHLESRMAKGTVKWFNSQKGYGFIAPQGGGKDVFVHISAVERAGLSGLNEGQVVEYEEVANKGKTSAENLKVQR
jgi:cold shock protein